MSLPMARSLEQWCAGLSISEIVHLRFFTSLEFTWNGMKHNKHRVSDSAVGAKALLIKKNKKMTEQENVKLEINQTVEIKWKIIFHLLYCNFIGLITIFSILPLIKLHFFFCQDSVVSASNVNQTPEANVRNGTHEERRNGTAWRWLKFKSQHLKGSGVRFMHTGA